MDWSNWSGSQHCAPARIARPTTRAEVAAATVEGPGPVPVVVAVTLRCAPAFRLDGVDAPEPIEDMLSDLPARTAKLAPRYPRWDAFAAIRARLDPGGRFANAWLRHVLG